MGKIISFIQTKGGAGKSTAARNIAACMTRNGYRVLIMDADPQGSISLYCGADRNGATFYDILTGAADINETIQHTDSADIIPNDARSYTVREQIPGNALKLILAPFTASYDYVIIDTPGDYGTYTAAAIIAADYNIIPVLPDAMTISATNDLIQGLYNTLKAEQNPTTGAAVLINQARHYKSTRERIEAIRGLCGVWGVDCIAAEIRSAAAVGASHDAQKSVFEIGRSGKNVAIDYDAVTHEIISLVAKGAQP